MHGAARLSDLSLSPPNLALTTRYVPGYGKDGKLAMLVFMSLVVLAESVCGRVSAVLLFCSTQYTTMLETLEVKGG